MTCLFNLVNKQIKEYSLKIRLAKEKKEQAFQPCITISRENGSGGHEIADKVAEKLGFKCFNEELIDLIAKKTHLKKELIKSVDEKTHDTIETIINTFLGFTSLPEHEYIRALTKVILAIAHKGKAVILGRGGNFIIPPRHTLKVRIIAPFKVRINNSLKFEYPGRSLAYVKEKLLKTHVERKNFVRKYFGKDLGNPNYYDLVINTEKLSIDHATEIIIASFKQKFG